MCETFPNLAMGDNPDNKECWGCAYFRYGPSHTIDGADIEYRYDGYCDNPNRKFYDTDIIRVKGRDRCSCFLSRY